MHRGIKCVIVAIMYSIQELILMNKYPYNEVILKHFQ
jgi:hypothetical protein